jgi:hypothetical protein
MSNPYDSNDETFFVAVGRLALAWGLIDSALAALVKIIHTHFGGQKIERDIPESLSRKIDYLRRSFSRTEALKPIAHMIRPTLTEISKASETRHDIIHGILLSAPEATQSTQMVRFLRRKRSTHKIFSISTPEILVHAEGARNLGTYVVNFVNALGEFLSVQHKVSK